MTVNETKRHQTPIKTPNNLKRGLRGLQPKIQYHQHRNQNLMRRKALTNFTANRTLKVAMEQRVSQFRKGGCNKEHACHDNGVFMAISAGMS